MSAEDELAAEQTTNYKGPGQLKTQEELAKLDYSDSLKAWEASLGLQNVSGGSGRANVEVIGLTLHSPGRQDTVVDLTKKEDLKKSPINIKEGAEFSVSIQFKVNNSIVSGMQYIQVVKRAGVKVDKHQEMIGSYGPSQDVQTKKFASEEAPSGMLARATYTITSRVTDDDKIVHAEWVWAFKISKDWN